jgi:hypothetical protein
METKPPPATEPSSTSAASAASAPSTPEFTGDPLEQARSLWVKAIDAQAAGDYRAAVRYYEQIKQLPPTVWPAGLEFRLEAAREHVK